MQPACRPEGIDLRRAFAGMGSDPPPGLPCLRTAAHRGAPRAGGTLAMARSVNLNALLARCRAFEGRAAVVYRTFAARTRNDPELCSLWTALARDEEAHARAIGRAAGWLDPTRGWHTSLDGWGDDLDEIETRLADAERPDIGADVDRQLVAALALERTELDTLYHRLLAILPPAERSTDPDDHTAPLLALAAHRATNPAVALEAALLQARHRLRRSS